MRKKCGASRGFSLSELLVAVLILGLIGLALAAGIPTALRVYRSVSVQAEAELLCSTLSTALSDELRYARQPRQSSGTAVFQSTAYGREASFTLEDGRIQIGGSGLMSEKAYTSGLEAMKCDVTYADRLFHVALEVGDGTAALASAEFDVRALNG